MAERLAALHRLQQPAGAPQLMVTTANAVGQRTLTPFRIRQLVAKLAPGERIGRDRLAERLQANGYVRVATVADSGEFAVRGGLVELFPSGEESSEEHTSEFQSPMRISSARFCLVNNKTNTYH